MLMRLLIITSVVALAACTLVTANPPSTMPNGAELSCKLSPAELSARRGQLIPGLFKRADKVEDIENGLRFHFANQAGLLTELAKIMEQEQDCCSFLRIALTMEASEAGVTFDVTGPAGTADMLRKL